jgi:hypothetical protein
MDYVSSHELKQLQLTLPRSLRHTMPETVIGLDTCYLTTIGKEVIRGRKRAAKKLTGWKDVKLGTRLSPIREVPTIDGVSSLLNENVDMDVTDPNDPQFVYPVCPLF